MYRVMTHNLFCNNGSCIYEIYTEGLFARESVSSRSICITRLWLGNRRLWIRILVMRQAILKSVFILLMSTQKWMSDFDWSLRRFPHIARNHSASTHVTLYKTAQNTVLLSALRQQVQDALKLSCCLEILPGTCTLYDPVLRRYVWAVVFWRPNHPFSFPTKCPEGFKSVCKQSGVRSPEKEEVRSGGETWYETTF